MGGVGTGKTLLMRICQRFLAKFSQKDTFSYKHINQLANEYIEYGFSVLERFDKKDLWIDEVGLFDKESIKRYGNNSNIFEELIMHRYEKFIYNGVKTHITTNLTPQQIEAEYNPRIWSRLKEMCNMIPLTGKDRRDYAKPKPVLKSEQLTQKTEQEQEQDIAQGILEHWRECQKAERYLPCGVFNMLAWVYYDFLDRHQIIQYTPQQKYEALKSAQHKIGEAHNQWGKSLKNEEINIAKAILFEDFILNQNVQQKLSKFL
jgi:hypothetical protein